MNIVNIILSALQITGTPEGIAILLNITLGYDYYNGQRGDTPTHLKYEIVCPDNGYEKIRVKVPGTKPVISAEQLAQQGGKIKVKFKNLTGKFYRTSNGEYALSCSADSVEVI